MPERARVPFVYSWLIRGLALFGMRPRLFPGPLVGLVKGRVERNWGFCRACVTASNPEASLMSLGSLNAVPMKEMPRGTPKDIPDGTLMIG